MAQQGSKKGSAPKKRPQQANNNGGNRQLTALIIFAVSVLWLCLAIINAGGLWGAIRTFLFGVFGFCTFILPILMLAVAVLITLDKTNGKSVSRILQAFVVISLICSIVHIFQCDSGSTYFATIKDAYNYYKIDGSMLGGGAWGAVLGGILMLITGDSKPAALVIAFIILFVLIMVITGLTLANLIRGISKPVKKIGEVAGEKITEYGERVETHTQEREKRKREFKADVDLGPDPIKEPVLAEAEPETEPEEDTLVPFSDITPAKEEKKEQEKVINLDDIIKKNTLKNQPAPKEEVKAEEKPDDDGFDDEDADKPPYVLPTLDCLAPAKEGADTGFEGELKQNAQKLIDTLNSFGVETRIVDIARGPSVTRYEIQPAAGVKISKITNLTDDIALNLAAGGIRIEAPIPNKAAVGIEIPNKKRTTVTFREIVDTQQYKSASSKLFVALGKDIGGNCMYADLAKMPHLLVAGTTGSGKSVCMNAMIVSILYNASPDEVKLLMIDPKKVEFTVYNGIPHLIVPVVSDPRKASGALAWAVTEMLTRYKMFSDNNVRDISGYNSICESIGQKKMPQIVIFIDELSDLMMAAPHEVEDSICRLAQMARAAGMHLVIATQRPSVDVITGLIKANIPSRLALKTSSQIDSRTIIDSAGAEKLLGNGDMLFYPVGIAKPLRIQGCFLSDKEVETVVDFIKKQEQSEYDDEVMQEIERQAANNSKKKESSASSDDADGPADDMLPKAIEAVVEAQSASTTLLQRKLKLGYARAARIVDELEERGIIGPYEGAKPRKVLISKQQWYEMNALAQGGADSDYTDDGGDYSEE